MKKESLVKLAYMARLKLKDDEIVSLSQDIDHLLAVVKPLQDVDTDFIQPLVTPFLTAMPFAKDETCKDTNRETVLSQCHSTESQFFSVPHFMNR